MSRIPDVPLTDDVPVYMRNNLHRTLNNNPEMFDAFKALASGVHTTSHLEQRTRELVILRISATLGSDVEWAQHFKLAQGAGVTLDEARALRDGVLSGFAPEERAAVEFAEAVEACGVDDDAWARAALHYSPVQLLDLTLLTTFYALACRVTLALGVEVDEGLTPIAGLDQL